MPTFLQRYMAGDCAAVWRDLCALGEGVHLKRYYADAAAVADETMRRARQNIVTLIPRLADAGYRFAAPALERELRRIHNQIEAPQYNAFMLQKMQTMVAAGRMPASALSDPKEHPAYRLTLGTLRKRRAALEEELNLVAVTPPLENPRVFYPPEEPAAEELRMAEKLAGGPLPLSLRSWYEHVGFVSLGGAHPLLNPEGCATPDPLTILPLAESIKGLSAQHHEDRAFLTISMSDRHKAGLEGGDPYAIAVPCPAADAVVRNEWRQTTFVDYLRSAFAWGGFPGWERDSSAPREVIAALTEGLLPI